MYDSVTKYLIETYTPDYATWLLGKAIELTKLEPSELSLEPIRADSLLFLEGEDIILHIGSQTRPSEDTACHRIIKCGNNTWAPRLIQVYWELTRFVENRRRVNNGFRD